MRCLVTGGAGFIGHNLVKALIDQGHSVTVVDNLSTGVREKVHMDADFVYLDIAEMTTENVPGPFDVVFHTAALARIQPSIIDPVPYHDANVTGTLKVLLAAKEWGAKVVYSSSSSIYGVTNSLPMSESLPSQPGSPYSAQKYMGEVYCRMFSELYGLRTVTLRYFNVYGEGQLLSGAYAAVVGIFIRQRDAGEALTIVGDGNQRRDFTWVGDVVRANVLAADMADAAMDGSVINVGTGSNHSINQIAELVDPGGKREHLPERKGEYPATLAGNSKAHILLGWEPSMNIADWIFSQRK